MNEKGLGLRLQKARKAAGLTQQELCQKSGLSYSTLAKIERGAIKSPSIFTIHQIAMVLNLAIPIRSIFKVEDLITMKEAAARDQDLADADALRRLLKDRRGG